MRAIDSYQNFTFSGVTSVTYLANIGEGIPKHDHTYPHLTVCLQGSIIVRKEGKEVTVTPKDGAIYLPEKQWHEIEAAEDNTIFQNVFSFN